MKKVFCMFLAILMLVSLLPTVFFNTSSFAAQTIATDQSEPITTAYSKDLTITIGSVNASPNEIITVPINLTNVPQDGIYVFDIAIKYDETKLEYFDYAPGSIIKNPESNFAMVKEKDGLLKMLFMDYNLANEHITSDGLLLNLHFKVLETSISSTSISASNLSFGGHNLEELTETTVSGLINISESAVPGVFAVRIGSTRGEQGDMLIPINFENVPAEGVSTCEMTIKYNPLLIEFLDYETGNIINNQTSSFEINKLSDGNIKLIFLCNTTEHPITSDGLFANLKFKILDSFVNPVATIDITDTNFTNIYNDSLDAMNFSGQIFFSNTPTPTPPPPKKLTVTVGEAIEISESLLSIPVTLKNVPNDGISSVTMYLYYDSDILEYQSYKKGSIASNLTVNKVQDGILSLVVDNTSTDKDNYIKDTGQLLTIDFEIRTPDDKNTLISLRDAYFLDKFLNPVDAEIEPDLVYVTGLLTPIRSNLKISVDSAHANTGDLIEVPIKFTDVPEGGIGSVDMTINYDADFLEYVSSAPGSIVDNVASNFYSTFQYPGSIRLMLQYTSKETCISTDGIFATITFKVLQASDSLTQILISQPKVTNRNLRAFYKSTSSGFVNISGQPTPPDTDLHINLGSAQVSKGKIVAIPVCLTNVTSIPSLMCKIKYDTSKLNYDHYEAGSIIPAPSTLFNVLSEKDGNLELLFLNFLMCNDYNIQKDGLLVTLFFKATETSSKTPLNFDSIIIHNNNLDVINVKSKSGYIDIIEQDKYTISGYISTDLIKSNSQSNEGFVVALSRTNLMATTDEKGYFEIKSVPVGIYNIEITKSNFLSRELENILIDNNKELSTESNPLLLWGGDIEISGIQDGAINFEDIMAMCKVFNSLSGDKSYKENMDFNKDGAINLEDIMIIARHFNKTSSDYQ